MRMMTIASGSSGNATLVMTDETALLIDAGVSLKKIDEGLSKAGISAGDLDGVLITHEHNDHIKGLGILMRKHEIPVYATEGTMEGIASVKNMGKYDASLMKKIGSRDIFSIGDMEIRVNPISHDAREPVCYSFHASGSKAVIATDMGCFNEDITAFLKDADAMLIEANHDVRMLESGPYPYDLKRRILGERGHLSNEASGRLILGLLNSHISGIVLGHLSKENNFKELAYETVRSEICDNPFSDDVRDFNLMVAERDIPGTIIDF